jgi:hypothetical protein
LAIKSSTPPTSCPTSNSSSARGRGNTDSFDFDFEDAAANPSRRSARNRANWSTRDAELRDAELLEQSVSSSASEARAAGWRFVRDLRNGVACGSDAFNSGPRREVPSGFSLETLTGELNERCDASELARSSTAAVADAAEKRESAETKDSD